MSLIYSLKGCVKDTLPAAMTANCKRQNSCAKLGKNKCSWKFKGALNAQCKRNLKPWHNWQNAYVKTFCKQSCRNCARKFCVMATSFGKIACVIIFLFVIFTHNGETEKVSNKSLSSSFPKLIDSYGLWTRHKKLILLGVEFITKGLAYNRNL